MREKLLALKDALEKAGYSRAARKITDGLAITELPEFNDVVKAYVEDSFTDEEQIILILVTGFLG